MSLAVRSTTFTETEPRKIRSTHVEAWVKSITVATMDRERPLAPGTIKTLQVTDVDFLRREIHVRRQVQRVTGGEVEIRLPKDTSERTIHAAQALIDMLAEHVALGLTNEWLFEGNAKLPPHQNTVGHRWRTTPSRAGLTGIRLHDLRHFYASGLIASGCDVVAVQRALWHARFTTTLTTYAHLWPTAESRVRVRVRVRVRDESTRLAAEALGPAEGTVRADDA